MRRRGFLVLAGIALARPVQAQPGGPTPLRPGEVLRGRFVQERHLSGFSSVLRTEGHFVLAPGQGLIWQAETPFAVRTVITQAGLTQRIGEEETLRLSTDRIPFLARLSDMLTGTLAHDWRAMEQDFIPAWSGDVVAWRVVLTPRRPPELVGMPFERIIVAGGRLVETVEMLRPGGDSDVVHFGDQVVTRGKLSLDEQRLLDVNTRAR